MVIKKSLFVIFQKLEHSEIIKGINIDLINLKKLRKHPQAFSTICEEPEKKLLTMKSRDEAIDFRILKISKSKIQHKFLVKLNFYAIKTC